MLINKLNQKKGATELADVFYVIVFLFSAALLIFILYFVYQQIKEPVQSALVSGVNVGSQAELNASLTTMSGQTIGGVGMFNILFPFILLGLIAMVAVSAFFIDSHPIFFIVSLIILGVVILISVVFSNIFQTITTDDSFGDTSTHFNIMNLFMKNLPFIAVIVIVIVAIIIWGRPSGSSGGGL